MESIQSVKRAFAILEVIGQFPNGAQLADLAEATGLPKSTIVRMLATLEELEAVQRRYPGDGYRLGDAIARLVAKPSWLLKLAEPWLQRLAAESGETASLAVLDGDQLHYIAQYTSPESNIRVRDWTGIHVPTLHIASPGKLFLAYDETLRQRYVEKPLESITENTIDTIDRLDAELEQVCRKGYAWVREEFERGLSGVSAPIFDRNQQIVAAINLYGPSFRLPPPSEEAIFSGRVVHAAKEMTAQLAGEKIFTEPAA